MKPFLLFIILSFGSSLSSQVDELDTLQLIVGDTVKVNILNNFLEEEIAIPKVTINRKDKVILSHLGEFNLSGKNIGQFKDEIKQRVIKRLYLKNPNLLIDINKNILVSASIKNKFLGEYQLSYQSSLGELLKAINVITIEDMDPQSIILKRNNSQVALNLQNSPQLIKMTLKHNDYIKLNTRFENSSSFYYLVGNFTNIGRYYMNTKITLMDLLATQSLTQPKYTRKFYIFRKHTHDTMVIEVDARQLMKMGDLTQNISIQGGDVILASVERKMHLLQKYKDILNQYTDLDEFVTNAQNIRLFK